MNMKTVVLALTFSLLGACGLAGCSSDGAGGGTPPPADAAPTGMTPGGPQPGMMPGNMSQALPSGGGGANKGAGKTTQSSFDLAPDTIKQLWGQSSQGQPGQTGMPGAGGGLAGGKPNPIRDGVTAAGPRKDPFESVVKPVVQISPAWELVMNHRTAPPARPAELGPTGDIKLDLPPLPPIPRRVAGVFYNGSITAIIESGNPPDSQITIVQPGAEVPSGIPGIPDLTVESITMDTIVLRAKDGRTVDVKLSGLSPAVQDALRQQFGGNGVQGGGGFSGGGGVPGGGGSIRGGGGPGNGADLK